MNRYKELIIWQKSVALAVTVYKVTQDFPRAELYGLTSQIRRCVVSVASNIAEGAGRNSKREFSNFLGISNGSACELETQLIVANKVNLLSDSALASLQCQIDEIQRMNGSLKRSLLMTND